MMSVAGEAAPHFYWEETEDRTDMCGPGLRTAFARMGATWAHSILLPKDTNRELARAILCDPEGDDPRRVKSPVFQEIQRHESAPGAGLCLLLTGTLFFHHFSAVVSLGIDPDRPDGVLLDVDVADRCRAPFEILAATYTVMLDSGSLVDAGPQSITWDRTGPCACRIELMAVAPSTLVLAEAGRSATRVQVMAAIQAGNFTHRLHYRWRWTSNSGLTQ
jgi:hypothetical protein